MIETINVIAFTCDLDGCGEGIETGETEFGRALAHAKSEGWVAAKRQTGWKHFCSAAHERQNYQETMR